MARGWKGNALGLQRWEVQLVHDAATACLIGIENKVMAGMTFDAAKAAVIKSAAPAWKGFTPGVAEGVRKVVSSYCYADLSKAVMRHHRQHCFAQFPVGGGTISKRIEQVLYNLTGLTF